LTARRRALIAEIGAAVQAYQRSTEAFDDAVGRRLRMNPTDLRCLDWLAESPRSAGELSEATGLSSAATTTLLDRLEKRGLLRRVRAGDDRRKVQVELAARGRELAAQFYGPIAAEGSKLLSRFSEEQLEALHDFLVAARELTERHRARIRD